MAKLTQDLHIHTTWSAADSAIVAEQTIDLIAAAEHAEVVGISDHFEHIADRFDDYRNAVAAAGLLVGTEIDGHLSVPAALEHPCDYRIFHCYDQDADYRALETLLSDGPPVIVAHPNALDTDLARVPQECLIELNNRYVWRCDWMAFYGPFRDRFRFVLGSDAHQPNWLGQSIARLAARELGVEESRLFD